LLHPCAPLGESSLFRGLRRKPAKLISGPPQPLRFSARGLDVFALARELFVAGPALLPASCNFQRLFFEPAERIEEAAVGGDIEEGALGMLPVNFDKRVTDAAQHLRAHRLVVYEGARAPVRKLCPSKDQFIFCGDATLGKEIGRGGRKWWLEDSCHLPLLGALPHKRDIAAPAERECKGVEQNRFPRPGLAGQDGEAAGKIEFQVLNENDVSDG
jgi:hypothetical protein